VQIHVQSSGPSTISGTRVAAFFDVDNTLIPGPAIEVRFFSYLLKCRLVGLSEAVRSLWFWSRHIPPVSLHPLRTQKLYLTGKRPSIIEPLAEDFVRKQICPRLPSDGFAALEAHRRAGHRLVLTTGSLDFLVAPLALFLDVETVLAAKPERIGDHYTGRLLSPFPYGEGKQHMVEAFAAEHGLDLKQSHAYGDSPGDIEVLRSVGHPTVVNPIRGMARIARREGWPVAKWK